MSKFDEAELDAYRFHVGLCTTIRMTKEQILSELKNCYQHITLKKYPDYINCIYCGNNHASGKTLTHFKGCCSRECLLLSRIEDLEKQKYDLIYDFYQFLDHVDQMDHSDFDNIWALGSGGIRSYYEKISQHGENNNVNDK